MAECFGGGIMQDVSLASHSASVASTRVATCLLRFVYL